MAGIVARGRAVALAAAASIALAGVALVPLAGQASSAAAAGYDNEYIVQCGDTAGLISAFKDFTGANYPGGRAVLGRSYAFHVTLNPNHLASCNYVFAGSYDGVNALPAIGGDIQNQTLQNYAGDGLAPITESVVLDGNGASFIRVGSAQFRFLLVAGANDKLTVNNLTMSGGFAPDGSHSVPPWWLYLTHAIGFLAQQAAIIALTGGTGEAAAAAELAAEEGAQAAQSTLASVTSKLKTIVSAVNNARKASSAVASAAKDAGPVTPGENGGAVASDGVLVLNGTTFQSNHAGDGGNGADASGDDGAGGGLGGAVFVGETGWLTVTNSVFRGNQAGQGGTGSYGATPFTAGGGRGGDGGDGGAIASFASTSITGSTFDSNLAGLAGAPGKDWGVATHGGAYGSAAGVLLGAPAPLASTIDSSSFVNNGNLAGRGGAVSTVLDAAATVTNSTFVHNGASYGGQISALNTYGAGTNSIDVRNSVFTQGYSDNDGGLAYATAGNSISIENSAAFASGSGASDCAVDGSGSITTSSFYIVGASDPQCPTTHTGIANLGTGTGANLATSLTSFGISVGYIAPAGSVLRDAGDPAYCPAYDQRGLPRNSSVRGTCDIGTTDHFVWAPTSLGTIYEGNYGDSTNATTNWPWTWHDPSQWFIDNHYLVPLGGTYANSSSSLNGKTFSQVMSGPTHIYFYLPPTITVDHAHYVIKTFLGGTENDYTTDHYGNAITDPFLVPLSFSGYGNATVELWVTSDFGDKVKLDSQSFTIGNANNHAPTLTIDHSPLSVNQFTTEHYVVTVNDPDANASWSFSKAPDCGGTNGTTTSNLQRTATSFSFDCNYGAGASSGSYPTSLLTMGVVDDQGARSTSSFYVNPSITYQPALFGGLSSSGYYLPVGATQTFTYTLRGDVTDLATRAQHGQDATYDSSYVGAQQCGPGLLGPSNRRATANGTTATFSFDCVADPSVANAKIGKTVNTVSYAATSTGVMWDGSFRGMNYQIISPVDISTSLRGTGHDGVFWNQNSIDPNFSLSFGSLNYPPSSQVSWTGVDWGDEADLGQSPGQIYKVSDGWNANGQYSHTYTGHGTYTVTVYVSLGSNNVFGADPVTVAIWSTKIVEAQAAQPVITVPSIPIVLTNADTDSGTLHFTATATDPIQGTRNIQASCSVPDGSTSLMHQPGTHTVTCSASNGLNYSAWSLVNGPKPSASASASFQVIVKDVIAPVLGTPTVTQTVNNGATTVNYNVPVSGDSSTTLACDVPSGSVFLAGVTTVTCTATNAAGNSASISFLVNVGSGVGPTIAVPSGISGTSPNGAGVALSYTVSASDALGGPVTPSCLPLSGSVFAPGTTTVSCTATDGNGNWSSASFPVTVYGGTVSQAGMLQTQFSSAGAIVAGHRQNAVKLGADISVLSGSDGTGQGLHLASGDQVTLDLAGHALTIDAPAGQAGIEVPAGASLTIIDSSVGSTGSLTVRAQGGGAAIGGAICRSAGTIVIGAGVHGTAVSSGGDAVGGGAAIGAGAALSSAVLANWGLNAATIRCDSSISGGTVKFVGSAYGTAAPTMAGSTAGGTPSAPGASIGWTAPISTQLREALWTIAPIDTGYDGGIGFGPSGWLNVHLQGGSTSGSLGGPLAVPSQITFTKWSRNPGDLMDDVTVSPGSDPGVDDPTRSGYFFGGWRLGSATGDAWNYDRSSAASNSAYQQNVDVYASWIPVTGTGNDQQFAIPAGSDLLIDLRGQILGTNQNGTSTGPGIALPPTAKLTITDTSRNGTLTARGSNGSAGIGGGPGQAAGKLVITGGQVNSTGYGGAGVGGGEGGAGGAVELRGGRIAAISNGYGSVAAAAGIGAGSGATPGTGGSVTAYGFVYTPIGGPYGPPANGAGPAGLAAGFSLQANETDSFYGGVAVNGGANIFYVEFGHPVTFHLAGGSVPAGAAPYTVNDGDTIFAAPRGADLKWISDGSPQKAGYVFAGWYLDAAFAQPVDLSQVVVTGAMDIYAKWTPVQPALSPDSAPVVTTNTVYYGQTISVTMPTTWNGAAVTPDAIHYQWFRNGVPIRDAPDAATYQTKLADVNKWVTVQVTATAAGYDPYTSALLGSVVWPGVFIFATVDPNQPVRNAAWDYTYAGDTLTILNYAWQSYDGSVGTNVTPAAVHFTWYRAGVPIAGAADSPSYTATAADIGSVISVVATASTPGFTTYSITAGVTNSAVHIHPFTSPPTPTVTATCTPVVAGCWLTPVPGSYGSVPGLQLTYDWYDVTSSGVATKIANASYQTPVNDPYRANPYQVTDQFVPAGDSVELAVTATAPGYQPVTMYADQSTWIYVDGQHFTSTPAPSITDLDRSLATASPLPGDRLAASPTWSNPTWTPWNGSASYTYQWIVSDIGGANPQVVGTGLQVTVQAAWGGKQITVLVTGHIPGYYSTTVGAPVVQLPGTVVVHFDSSGGSAVADGGTIAGQHLPRPADPTRAGYTFAGWYHDASYGGVAFDWAGEVVTTEITLIAHWTRLPSTIDSWSALLAAFGSAPRDGTTVTTLNLWNDVTADTSTGHLDLPSGANVVIDLRGHTLTIQESDSAAAALGVEPGASVLIQDSVGGGTLEASTGAAGAGIGGHSGSTGGTIAILSGDVTASSGSGAGIGAGAGASGGYVEIRGGTVYATSTSGAGIGGGEGGSGGTVTITGGSLTASSTTGASIGAGAGGAAAGTLTIAGVSQGGTPMAQQSGAPAPTILGAGTVTSPYPAYQLYSMLTPIEYGGGSNTYVDYGYPVHADLADPDSFDSVGTPDTPYYLGNAPTRAGYVFVGWYSDAARTVPLTVGDDGYGNPITTITGPTTYYAKWVAQPVVAVDAGSGDCSATITRALAYGDVVCATLPGHTIAFGGYVAGAPQWTLDGDPVTIQWYLDGTAVDSNAGLGPHSPQYSLGASVIGHVLTVGLSATPATGSPYTASSDGGIPAVAPVLNLTAPTISGMAKVGQMLTVDPGSWSSAATNWYYTWYRDGSPVGNVDDPSADNYQLTAGDAGHAMTVGVKWGGGGAIGTSSSVMSAATATVAVPPPVMVTGTVAGTASEPIAGACVYLYTSSVASSASFASCTNPDGTFTIPAVTAGDYVIAVADPSGGYATWWSPAAVPVDGTTPLALAFTTAYTGTIQGFVTDGSGPLAGLTVYAYPHGVSSAARYATVTNADGFYWFPGALGGGYDLAFFDPSGIRATQWFTGAAGGAAAQSGAVSVGVTDGGVTAANAVLTTMLTGTIQGFATDSAGPLAGVIVYAYPHGVSSAARYATTTNADGFYWFQGAQVGGYDLAFFDPSGIRATQWFTGVTGGAASQSGAVSVSVTNAGVAAVDAVLGGAPGAVTGSVTDGSFPLAGVCVYLYQHGRSDAASYATCTGADGGWWIGGVVPGAYDVAFADGVHATQWFTGTSGGAPTQGGAVPVTVGTGVTVSGKDAAMASVG